MQALDRAITTLEAKTGFSRAFEEIVVHRGGWPNRWMTPEQINDELTSRGFWSGGRKAVHLDSRARLVQHYLDTLIDQPKKAEDSWAGGSPAGSSFWGVVGSPKRRAGDTDCVWKRFDGQYKHNPKTKLIEYRGAKMGRTFDRRSFLRVPTKDLNCQYGPVVNLSQAGLMFCMVDEKPGMKVGSRGFLRLTHGPTSLRVKVKVVWISPTPHGTRVGADFRGLTQDDQQTITQLLRDAGDPDAEPFDRRKD